jgi:hypothetical protein
MPRLLNPHGKSPSVPHEHASHAAAVRRAMTLYLVSNSVTVLCNCMVCVRVGRPSSYGPGAPDQTLGFRRGLHPKRPQPAARHSNPSIQLHHDRLWQFRHPCTVCHGHLVTSRRDGTGVALVCRRPGARGCYSLMRTESRLACTGAHRPVTSSDRSAPVPVGLGVPRT